MHVTLGSKKGLANAVEGWMEAGFRDVVGESFQIGFNMGIEGFVRFWWESGNLMSLYRREGFGGNLEWGKREMKGVCWSRSIRGERIPFAAGLVLGRTRGGGGGVESGKKQKRM